MKYGYFSETKKEYVITRPDTPTPWINYISNMDGYCGIISQTAGGFSFYKDPRDRRITKYRYNNIPVDRPGRYIYIKDMEDGDYWSPTWQPVQKKLEGFKCTHGLGYTKIESEYKEIQSKVTYFVPVKGSVEVWHLKLENKSNKSKTLSIIPYSEFTMWCEPESRNIQWSLHLTRGDFKEGFVTYDFIEPHPAFDMKANTNYVADRPGMAFMTIKGADIKDFDCVRDKFIGMYRSETNPVGLENSVLSDSVLQGGNGCAAIRSEVTLQPGESKDLVVLLGFAFNIDEAKQYGEKFSKTSAVKEELEKVKDIWSKYTSAYNVNTPDKNLNIMVNYWNQYQCKTTFDWSRYISFYENGEGRGMGTRDSSQDTFAVCVQLTDRVKARIVEILSTTQFETGDCYHQFFPLGHKGDLKGFSDDHLWLVQMVHTYIAETGQLNFLDEHVKYADSQKVDTVYQHLKAALDYTERQKGPNGLPLILTADWNDTLHLWMECEKPESVLTAQFYVYALKLMAKMAEKTGRMEDTDVFIAKATAMADLINEKCWDGKWYIRGFGSKIIGSNKNDEAKIFLNSQVWAVISGVATPERAKVCMDSVKELLASEEGVKKVWPTFSKYDQAYGLMSRYVKGRKENGIFAHSNSWAIAAEALLGRGDNAFEYYSKITPLYKNDKAEVLATEPYIYCQTICSEDSLNKGMGANSWLTGTASWMFVAVNHYILGIKPELDGLSIKPAIPAGWNGFTYSRLFRGCLYEIEVKRTGQKRIVADGVEVKGNILPVSASQKCKVSIEI
jgi:cellobiose phosphorylase